MIAVIGVFAGIGVIFLLILSIIWAAFKIIKQIKKAEKEAFPEGH